MRHLRPIAASLPALGLVLSALNKPVPRAAKAEADLVAPSSSSRTDPG